MNQLRLAFDGLGEAGLYHQKGPGFFSVLYRDADDVRQKSYPVADMARVLPLLPRNRDTYISQAEFFRPNRRVLNLSRIALQFVDLDWYKAPLCRNRDQVIALLLMKLDDLGYPLPSLIVDSGRGLQAKWLLDSALPQQALPRWNAVQRYLVAALEDLGADAGAKDASRVLRLVHTVNSKSNMVVQVAWTQETDGALVHYDFDALCEAVLPYARDELRDAKKQKLTVIKGGLHGLRKLSDKQLAWDRLMDLRTLSQLRGWGGGHPPGERDMFVFWSTCFAALGGVEPCNLFREAVVLGQEFSPSWSYHECQRAVSTVVRKAQEALSGVTVEYQGRRYSPLYTPRNGTLISQLKITPTEERQLRTIISKGEKKRRQRERKEILRRKAGAIPRDSYLGRASERRSQALKMAQEGLSQRVIAEVLQVSPAAVSGYLKRESSKSVRTTMGDPPAFPPVVDN